MLFWRSGSLIERVLLVLISFKTLILTRFNVMGSVQVTASARG